MDGLFRACDLVERSRHRLHESDALAPLDDPRPGAELGPQHFHPDNHGPATSALSEPEADPDEPQDGGDSETPRTSNRGVEKEIRRRFQHIQSREDAALDVEWDAPGHSAQRLPAAHSAN